MEKEAKRKAVRELKQELQRVIILIEESLKKEDAEKADDDDEFEMWLVDSAIRTVRALKELKLIGSDGGLRKLRDVGFQPPSKEFICPISGLVMVDPVVPTCGLSYERSCISKWLSQVNKKWPGTDQTLVTDSLIPNISLKDHISQWCMNPFYDAQEEEEAEEDDGAEKFYGLKLNQDEGDKPPQQLLCPISGNLMENPLLAASGQTFDELYIEKWVKEGNTKCPKTDQPLSHTLLIPNLSINSIIRKWRSRLALVQPDEDGGGDEHLVNPDYYREHLIDTLVKLPSLTTTSEQLPLLKDLRHLTARLPSFRILFADMDGAASKLLNPFLIAMYKSDAEVYNEVVATLMNISSLEDSNKPKILQDCPSLIPFLIDSLETRHTAETRGYAAAAIGQLSSHGPTCHVLGDLSIFLLLLDLLEQGDPMASREAAYAVMRLCSRDENRTRLIMVGGLDTLVEKLDDPSLLPVILEILALVSSNPITVSVVADPDNGVLPRLFRIMEETESRGDEANCVDVIFQVARKMPREVEKVKDWARILYRVSIEGKGRAKRIAYELLSKLKGKAPLK